MRDAEWEALAHAVGFQSAAGRLSQPRPVPYRNATAPRPLPRTMRPADVRANDPQLAQAERDIARRELQRGDTLGRLADMGAAQSAPDPIHTPLQSNVIAGSRMVLPGAYDAGNAAGRIARGEDAWGDLALNTGMAALPFLGARGMRGEPAPAPMREPLPQEAWQGFGEPRPYRITNAEDGFATYDFDANGRPYRVRMAAEDPENPSQVTVDFGPLGADESMSAAPTGDMRPADALRTMRTVTGILRDDAQTFQRGGYHWAGSPEHASLYDTMLSRYGAPEGYQVQRDPYGGASLQRAPAEAPRPNGPPQAASGGNAASGEWPNFGRPQNEFDTRYFTPSRGAPPRPVEPFAEMEWLQSQLQQMRQNQTWAEDAATRIANHGRMPGENLSQREMWDRAEEMWTAGNRIEERLDELRAANGLPTRIERAFAEGRENAADGVLPDAYMDLPRGSFVVREDGSIGLSRSPNANAPPPPDRTPKSLPRRKPPNGGFFMPRGNP